MSNLVMARIRPLNGPLLGLAEVHGRRLDDAAKRRKVRDEPSLTWVPDDVGGDPLALSDRLADHVTGALVPQAKTKALHMLIKLPESVPVETDADARAALDLMVQFAQDTYGGRAVFSARMDRDERTLNSVDLFLAPRYLKVTKRKSQEAMSLTRFGKLLAKKRGIEDRSDSAKGSMQAQGSALQDELADWLTARGFEAQRGAPKEQDGNDWNSPEVMGARKDRAAIEQLIAEQLSEVMEKRAEADRLLADAVRIKAEAEAAAEETKRHAETAARAAAAVIRAQAESDARTVRDGAKAEADRLASKTVEDRERRLVDAERTVSIDRARVDADRRRVDLQAVAVQRRGEFLEEHVSQQTRRLASLIEKLEPMLAVVAKAHERLQDAPDQVRRWLDGDRRVGEIVETVGPIVAQATEVLRKLVKRPQVAQPAPAEDVDLATQKAMLDHLTGRGGK